MRVWKRRSASEVAPAKPDMEETPEPRDYELEWFLAQHWTVRYSVALVELNEYMAGGEGDLEEAVLVFEDVLEELVELGLADDPDAFEVRRALVMTCIQLDRCA